MNIKIFLIISLLVVSFDCEGEGVLQQLLRVVIVMVRTKASLDTEFHPDMHELNIFF